MNRRHGAPGWYALSNQGTEGGWAAALTAAGAGSRKGAPRARRPLPGAPSICLLAAAVSRMMRCSWSTLMPSGSGMDARAAEVRKRCRCWRSCDGGGGWGISLEGKAEACEGD